MSNFTLTEALSKLQKVTQESNGNYKALCPVHDDHNPSLSITEKDGKILFKCWANRGCTHKGIESKLGLKYESESKTPVAIYDYKFADGILNFQVLRYHPKTFKQRRNENDWHIKGLPATPFGLEKWNDKHCPIYIVEGEKDVLNLEAIGLTATCNNGGAGKWKKEHSKFLKDRICLILPDNDEPGQKHKDKILSSLYGIAKEIKIVNVPDLPSKDISDFIEARQKAGKTNIEIKAEIESLVNASAVYVPEVILKGTATTSSDTEKIKAKFFEILTDGTIKDKNSAMADIVLDFLLKRGKLYYHSVLKTFDTSMFFDLEKSVLLKINSDEFQSWLTDYTGINKANNCYKYIYANIESVSLNNKFSQGIIPARFWHSENGKIYLSNGNGNLIKIQAGKYEVCPNGTDNILFENGYTLKKFELTEPLNPFENSSLFSDATFTDPSGFMLLQLFALSLPLNPKNKPIFTLFSEVGGGKTRIAVGVAEVYGIKNTITKIEENSESDFFACVANGGIYIADNVDTKIKWFADACSAVSTGSGNTKRTLYTVKDLSDTDPKSWVFITTSKADFATDPGFADRTLVSRLKRRTGETLDSELTDEINENRDAGLSFICDILSKALADTLPTPKVLNKRHPNFASFAVKLGRALGKEQEAIKALQSAEIDKSKFNIETDELGNEILSYMISFDKLEGTTAEILIALQKHHNEFNENGYWTAKRAGMKITNLETHLKELFHFMRIRQSNNCKITISNKIPNTTDIPNGNHGNLLAVLGKVPMREKELDFRENAVLDTMVTIEAKVETENLIINDNENDKTSSVLTIPTENYPLDVNGLCPACGYKREYNHQVQCPNCLKINNIIKQGE